jgi:hypothetical protein
MSSHAKRSVIAGTSFLLLAAAWIYGVLNRDPDFPAWVEFAALGVVAAAHVALGRMTGWRAAVLAFALPLIAAPAGTPDPDADVPISVVLVIWLPASLFLIAAGAAWRSRQIVLNCSNGWRQWRQ